MESSPIRIGFLCILMLAGPLLRAQNEEDALRISNSQPGGTARSTGMANAFGALGADASAIGINPAGGGLYRTAELSLTPSLEVNDVRSTYYGNSVSDSRTRFFFNNMALVLTSTNEKGGDWRSGNYGIVYDRQATHHWQREAIGNDVPSTILQTFVNEADGTQDSELAFFFPFTSALAWETYGINPTDSTGLYYDSAIPFGSPTRHVHSVESSGANTTTSFFYSGNYLDRLYVGASLGIAGHRYKRSTVHTETGLDTSLDLEEVSYTEDLNTSGSGLDLKLGIIIRVTDRFRMGGAYHSPQWMRSNDSYITSMRTTFRTPDSNGISRYSATSPDGFFSYQVNTAWRGVLSAAYIAGSNGLVSVDYSYADYRSMRFKPGDRQLNDYAFELENGTIRDSFRSVHSVRVGTEWRSGPWYYRLGWGYVPDAYRTTDDRHGRAQRNYAGGLGYRADHFGVDLGLNYQEGSMVYYQYAPTLVGSTTERRRNYRAMLTLSFRT